MSPRGLYGVSQKLSPRGLASVLVHLGVEQNSPYYNIRGVRDLLSALLRPERRSSPLGPGGQMSLHVYLIPALERLKGSQSQAKAKPKLHLSCIEVSTVTYSNPTAKTTGA
jgi:hypothetical protein